MKSPVIAAVPFDRLEGIVPLFEAQLREHAIDFSKAALLGTLQLVTSRPELGFILAASMDGEPVGVAYAVAIPSLEHGGWSGWLEDFYLLPEWRGQGIGTQLLAALISEAAERGWAAVDLEVDSAHRRAIPLYERSGFRPVSRTRYVRRLCTESAGRARADIRA